jgi:predicted ABC-type transport system involved in lysophospholipase L1 biosynthesis ATPase subunit
MSESSRPKGPSPLVVRGIRRSFKVGERRIEILHGVDLDLHDGERLCLMGASGAGKTTLLNVIGLLDRPDEGSVQIMGTEAWAQSAPARARLRNRSLGFVFQFYHLLPELSALENATLTARLAGLRGGALSAQRDRAAEILRRFGLNERLSHRPGRLSGGEQQRVAIARALLLDPPVLVADEPTGNLDRATGERVLELLFEEQERRAFSLLLVTHDERLAQRCSRVVYMEDGLIQADSTTPIPH